MLLLQVVVLGVVMPPIEMVVLLVVKVTLQVQGTATAGQGNAGGTNQGTAGTAGGGGGAGGAGSNASGGVGAVSTLINSTISAAQDPDVGEINGSDVYFAGGGAGGSASTVSGGLGGGGTGAASDGATTAGTVNTGGGGGGLRGGTGAQAGKAGGSGVVILSVPTARYSGTVGDSPEVTTLGSNTVIIFQEAGTYTA